NLIVDSFQWSPVNMSLRSTLFDKVNITGTANLDPYAVDTIGRRIDHLLWKDGKLGRLTSGSLALSTSLRSKSKENAQTNIPAEETLTPDEQQQQLEYIRENPAEFVDFNIPWNLSLSYSLNFYK